MRIYIENNQSAAPIKKRPVRSIVKAFLALEEKKYDEVSLYFVDTETICALHDRFFDDPSSTDCISFPIDSPEAEGYRVMGDIFICPQTALDYAQKQGLDPYEEISLYIIHGLLHLIGYDDIKEKDRSAMRAAESKHMKNLKNHGLTLNHHCLKN